MERFSAQVFVFFLGAVVGTLLDQIHVRSGVLAYAHPVLFGQAAWVPVVFGSGGLLLVNGQRFLLVLAGGDGEPAARSLATPALLFVGAYLLTGLGAERPLLVLGLLVAVWVARLARAPGRDLALAGAAFALGGPLYEAMLSATGAFAYRRPGALGVPCWLPALYLHAAGFTRAIYLELTGRQDA